MARSTYGLSHDEFKKAQNAVKTDELINKHEEVALLDDIPLPIKAIGAAMALPAAVKEGLKILQRKFEKGPLLDNTYNKRQLQSMADPLPHPSKDTRKKPNPNSKPSSPSEDWRDYTGKGPAKASLENPNMDILLPYVVDPEDEYSRPSDDPEMRRRGWNISHKKHYRPDGWSAPSPEHHDSGEHKQYDPGGGELYNPLDGGDLEPWGPRHEELISHNYRPGPTSGSIYNELMIRANQLMNSSNPEYQQRGLELLKISPQLYKLESL